MSILPRPDRVSRPLGYGRSTVRYAAEGPERADWHTHRQFLSPAFTMRRDGLAVARRG